MVYFGQIQHNLKSQKDNRVNAGLFLAIKCVNLNVERDHKIRKTTNCDLTFFLDLREALFVFLQSNFRLSVENVENYIFFFRISLTVSNTK